MVHELVRYMKSVILCAITALTNIMQRNLHKLHKDSPTAMPFLLFIF